MGQTEWRKVKLGEFLPVLTDYHANGSYQKLKENVRLLDEPDYAIMIRTTNFEKNDFSHDLKFIDKHAYAFLSKSKVLPGDILMNKIANAGSIYLMPNLKHPVSLGMNLFLIRMNREYTDQKYVYYYLKENEDYIKLFAVGTAAKTITKQAVRELEIRLPPLPAQRKIAAILSAYDDLIENNLRQIQILEKMARNLYCEWFVKFRFPGYQRARFTESPLGRIPEDWEVLPIKDLGGKVVLGGTPARKNPLYWENGTIPWLKSGKLNDLRVMDGTEFITDAGLRESATKLMPPKTVLIAITGAILISFLEIDACANQSVAGVFSLKKCSPEYLHLYLYENISLLESKMSGSAQQHVNKSIVEDIPVLIPSARITSRFVQFAEPQYEMVANLLKRNAALRRTRDLLLPRLISGEVDVSELDIAIREEGKS